MNQNFIKIVMVFFGLLLAIYAVPTVLTNRTGGVSALIVLVGVVTSVWALINPKQGLYLALLEVLFLDYFKKLAVYYGAVSTLTIVQVLAVSMVCISCVYAGIILKWSQGRLRIRKGDLLAFGLMVIIGLVVFVASSGEFVSRVQASLNTGLYVGLIPAYAILFRSRQEIRQLLGVLTLCFTAWALMGLHQYFVGFGEIEMWYAETGLSPVSSNHLLMTHDPTPIGFGSGRPNYGAIGLFFPVAVWLTVTRGSRRWLWGICSLIIFAGMVTAGQRSMFLLPLIGMGFYLFAVRPGRLIVGYAMGFFLIGLGIAFSGTLLHNLDAINEKIHVEGRLGKVIRVGTFSDRLRGWERFKDLDNYTLFGSMAKGKLGEKGVYEREYHDVLNFILEDFGAVGLALFLITLLYIVYKIHRSLFSIQVKEHRLAAIFMISALVPIIVGSLLGGSNFQTNPINVVVWTFAGCAFTFHRLSKEQFNAESKVREAQESTKDVNGGGQHGSRMPTGLSRGSA